MGSSRVNVNGKQNVQPKIVGGYNHYVALKSKWNSMDMGDIMDMETQDQEIQQTEQKPEQVKSRNNTR